MHAAGGQAQHDIAGRHARTGQDLGFLHRTDREAGQVVLPRRIHARHLGGFSPDQCASGQLTAPRNAANDSGGGVHVQLAACEVVQEKQRFGALHQDVVDTHGDQVDAHGVVHVPLERQLELGADAVCATHQDRLPVALGHFKEGAEAADPGQYPFAHGLAGQRLDAFDQRITGVDVHASVLVVEGGGWGRVCHRTDQVG